MIAHPPFQPSVLALAERSTLSVKSGDFIQSWTWKYRIGETGKNHKAPTALTSDKYVLLSLQTQETARVRNVLRKCHKNLMNPLISTILVQSQWGVHCQLLVSSQPAPKHWNGHNEQLPRIQSDSTTCIIHTTENSRSSFTLQVLQSEKIQLFFDFQGWKFRFCRTKKKTFQDDLGYKSELMDGKRPRPPTAEGWGNQMNMTNHAPDFTLQQSL